MTDNLLKFSANLDRNQLLTNQEKSELSCHVNIESDVITGDESGIATTANICLVFDCSFSMAGKKFKTAINTAKMIVDILHERHSISLVAFEIRSHVVFKNAVPTEENKESIKKNIDKISDHLGGSTNMAAGIKTAMDVLSESEADADVIVLLSDGVADSAEKALMAAEEASKRGIQIFAVGIGESYNTDQLLSLVTPSNGAVFGDTEGDKINDIFQTIIGRIDQIFASKVKLDFTFNEHVQLKRVFKTRPERALYDSLSIDSDRKLELQVGNVENNKIYEFLLKLEVDSHDVGTTELMRARIQYDINDQGTTKQQIQEIILIINYTESDTSESATNNRISSAMKSATMMEHCTEVVQACSRSDHARALKAINQLQKKCDEEKNTVLPQHLDSLKIKLENGHKISDKDRNNFLLACTVAPPKIDVELLAAEETIVLEAPPEVEAPPEATVILKAPPVLDAPPEATVIIETPPEVEALPDADLYDCILVEPGSETIRLLREIRSTTNMGIPEIADIIRSRNSLIAGFKNKSDAENFQQRLVQLGAKVKIQASGENN